MYAAAVSSSASFYLYKDGSFHKYLNAIAGHASGSGQVHLGKDIIMQVTDSPSTTSAVTYAIFWKRNAGSGAVHFNNYATSNNETRSWYSVEEIAA